MYLIPRSWNNVPNTVSVLGTMYLIPNSVLNMSPQMFYDDYLCNPSCLISGDFIQAGRNGFGFYLQKGRKQPIFARFHFSKFPTRQDWENFAADCNPNARKNKTRTCLVVCPNRPTTTPEVVDICERGESPNLQDGL